MAGDAIHVSVGVTTEEFARYIDIDNDVVILADNTDTEICVAADCGTTQLLTQATSMQTLALPASRMPSIVMHAATAKGGCAHVGEKASVALINGARRVST